ncbi:tRNA (adenosine(37)-N6)-dimethylallyltransferase MiaA [Winogradskyella aurantia]|uniref:tRNA dimethylallyltransferase n=1 Tax=Winogradskyella aurantia TaxID=1915063 RepID=A0A265UMQ7_9FLAO|nr:tRNA (adenosine(37)-N6)-dimethylallyltransferase MiaA [Winogradskyella aurantia]OZV66591.1 tRNA (adenosine(37)-N6)-dimethylallyltransferase MiaA [Winogradskyella aurantia]
MPKLITIVGPTAIGKTALSIKLARYFKCEIISSDSRQFYQEMCIGTAVPSDEELKTVPHHFIQHKSIHENYNVGDFESDAISKLEELHKHNPYAVMVGGSGLYVKAILEGLDYFPKVENIFRYELNKRLKSEGLSVLQEQLKGLDPVAYNTIAIDNPQRVIRALEICLGTGKPYSTFLTNSSKKRNFEPIIIGLVAERSMLYERINKRVDLMVSEGLVDEARRLLPFKNVNALNTVGYKELFAYFDGHTTLDFAISEIKKNSRRFAKRQLTWFRKNKNITWFDFKTQPDDIIRFIENKKSS